MKPAALLLVFALTVLTRALARSSPAGGVVELGFLLIAAYLFGSLVERWRLPRITGYLVVGFVCGPTFFTTLGLDRVAQLLSVPADIVRDLGALSQLALAIIGFSAGGEVHLPRIRERSRQILVVFLGTSVVVVLGCAAVVLLARRELPFLYGMSATRAASVAALLGVLAVARSPSSVMAVLNETRARGAYAATVLDVTMLVDVAVIVLFAAAVNLTALSFGGGAFDVWALFMIVLEVGLTLAIGTILGVLLTAALRLGAVELPVLIIALGLLIHQAGAALHEYLREAIAVELRFEPLLICMTCGFVLRNFSNSGHRFFEAIDRFALPLYVVFFALTGASIDAGLLPRYGGQALIFVAARLVFLFLGGVLAARLLGESARVGRRYWMGFATQAGVCLGLVGALAQRFPGWGREVLTLVVAVVAINQLIGPVLFKMALGHLGESRTRRLHRALGAAPKPPGGEPGDEA